jgi:hypothetical protein
MLSLEFVLVHAPREILLVLVFLAETLSGGETEESIFHETHIATTDGLFLMNLNAFFIWSSPSKICRLGYEIRRLYTQIRNRRKPPAKKLEVPSTW